MYLQAWRKYLPVIMILIKRSAQSPQTLAMDMNDFVKSSGGKKLKLGFVGFSLNKGRMTINPTHPQIAKDLVMLLQESDQGKSLLLSRSLLFSMSNECTLQISDTAIVQEIVQSVEETN
jgi:hypothetical protein